jgi:hypothetical protein
MMVRSDHVRQRALGRMCRVHFARVQWFTVTVRNILEGKIFHTSNWAGLFKYSRYLDGDVTGNWMRQRKGPIQSYRTKKRISQIYAGWAADDGILWYRRLAM